MDTAVNYLLSEARSRAGGMTCEMRGRLDRVKAGGGGSPDDCERDFGRALVLAISIPALHMLRLNSYQRQTACSMS